MLHNDGNYFFDELLGINEIPKMYTNWICKLRQLHMLHELTKSIWNPTAQNPGEDMRTASRSQEFATPVQKIKTDIDGKEWI